MTNCINISHLIQTNFIPNCLIYPTIEQNSCMIRMPYSKLPSVLAKLKINRSNVCQNYVFKVCFLTNFLFIFIYVIFFHWFSCPVPCVLGDMTQRIWNLGPEDLWSSPCLLMKHLVCARHCARLKGFSNKQGRRGPCPHGSYSVTKKTDIGSSSLAH